MTSRARKKSESYDSIFASWGLPFARFLRRRTTTEPVLELWLATALERVLVGSLARDDEDGYVFTYAQDYRRRHLPPITDFPHLSKPNTFERLPAFFEARIPPLHRADVAEMLREKAIDESDVFAILGQVAPRTISSPYEFQLRAA